MQLSQEIGLLTQAGKLLVFLPTLMSRRPFPIPL